MILLSSLLIALASAQPMLSVNDDGVSFLIESSRGQFGRFASPPSSSLSSFRFPFSF